MCVLCELKQELKEYPNIPKKDFEKTIKSWEKARMRAMSTLPFEALNRFLKKIDKHFFKILDGC